MLGWATLLRNKQCTSAEIQQGIEVIERNCRPQAQLMDDALEVSRIISGRFGDRSAAEIPRDIVSQAKLQSSQAAGAAVWVLPLDKVRKNSPYTCLFSASAFTLRKLHIAGIMLPILDASRRRTKKNESFMIPSEQARIAQRCCLAALLAGLSFAAHAQTAAETARLASATGYLETGGLKIGMSLKDLAPATRALNPLMKLSNTERVTIWPPDATDMTKTAPPDSPVSVRTLTLQTIQGRTPGTDESVVVTLAMYPSMPVVTTINRVVHYADGTGPNYGQILDAIGAKYGQATETQVLSDSASLRMRQLRWYFDRNGKLMPPIAPYSVPPCGSNMTNCPDRSMFALNISASGSGIVKSMSYEVGNGPLALSAQQATDAYLQSVEHDRTRRQNEDSKGRPLPKL
jgi:hypothetical protein